MTLHVTLSEAQERFAELVARVQEGEEVLIDDGGRVVATLAPASPAQAAPKEPAPPLKRRLGIWEHLNIHVADETFLAPDEQLERLMDEPSTGPSLEASP